MRYSRVVFTSFIAYASGHNLGLAAFTGRGDSIEAVRVG